MRQGDVISYLDMCREEGVNLQRGMNFRLRGGLSVVLMSIRPGAPYADRIEADGRVLVYEGHDVPTVAGGLPPKSVDQPMNNPQRSGHEGLCDRLRMVHGDLVGEQALGPREGSAELIKVGAEAA